MHCNRLLQTLATVLLLAACAAASVVPDWATVLKAQSYYGAVDLALNAQPAGALRAGTTTDVLVTLANAGPDDAHGARTHAMLNGAALAAATAGCAEDPSGFPLCTVSAPLPAGGTSDYLLRVQVPARARGRVALALYADSWDVETNPGQESVLLDLPIEQHVDLRASVLCDHPYLAAGAKLSCQVILHNFGPAAAFAPRFTVDVDGANVIDSNCSASRNDLCPPALPAKWASAVMDPGDTAVLWFQLTAAASVESVATHVAALAGGEVEDIPSDNADTLSIPVPLFRDGFEAAAASTP